MFSDIVCEEQSGYGITRKDDVSSDKFVTDIWQSYPLQKGILVQPCTLGVKKTMTYHVTCTFIWHWKYRENRAFFARQC